MVYKIDENTFFFAYNQNGGGKYLTKMDIDGNILWSKGLTNYSVFGISDIIPSYDNNYYVTGWGSVCDVISPAAITKIDSLGNEIWTVEIGDWEAETTDNYVLYNYNSNPDGDFIHINTPNYLSSVADYGMTGEFLNDLPVDGIVDIRSFADSETGLDFFYSAGKDGLYQMYFFGGDLILLGDFYQVENLGGDTLALLSDSLILKLDPPNIELQTFNFSNFGTAQKFVFNENGFWLLGRSPENQSFILRFNENLTFIDQIEILTPNQVINDIELIENQLFITGEDHIKNPYPLPWHPSEPNTQSASAFVKTYTLEGQTTDFSTDIGVTNVTADTIVIFDSFIGSCNGFSVFVDAYFTNIEIEVTNFGADTINAFNLNTRHQKCNFFCLEPYRWHHWQFDSLSLPPNESMIVNIDTLTLIELGAATMPEFCFWTSAPNQKIDRDHSNDEHCQNFQVIINNTDEISANDFSLELFPNPTFDQLFLKFPKPLPEKTELHFYNNLSQKIKTIFTEKGTQEMEIEVSDFERGLYFMEMEIDGKGVGKRFVKL